MSEKNLIKLLLVAAQAFGNPASAHDISIEVGETLTPRVTVIYHQSGVVETRSPIPDMVEIDDDGSIYIAVGTNGDHIEPTTAIAQIKLSASFVTVSTLAGALNLTFPCTNDPLTNNLSRLRAQITANNPLRYVPNTGRGSTDMARAATNINLAITAAANASLTACTKLPPHSNATSVDEPAPNALKL